MNNQEKTYPGIGLLIAVGGSLVLWVLIIWLGHAIYTSLQG